MKLPDHHQEDWRWSSLDALVPAQAGTAQGFTGEVDGYLPESAKAAPLLVFIDGQFDATRSRTDTVKIGKANINSDQPLAAMAAAQAKSGWQIDIGAGHASHGTIHILHIATGGPSHLAARIRMAEDAQASVFEHYVSVGDVPAWVNVALVIEQARASRLMRHVLQAMDKGAATFFCTADIAQGASLDNTLIARGGEMMRAEHHIHLQGQGAFAAVDGALIGRGTQHFDVHNVIRHSAAGGTSRQTWRSVLDDQSLGAIAARVEVARDAQESDATQSLKALLLSRGATANAKPELEIFADHVQCAHGATVGELDPLALFYLQSRGLPLAEARALLTQAFIGDVIAQIGDEAVREYISTRAMERLA